MNKKQDTPPPANPIKKEPLKNIWPGEEDEQTGEKSEKVIGKPTTPRPADADTLAKALDDALRPPLTRTAFDTATPRRRVDWEMIGVWLFWLAVIGGVVWYVTSNRLAVESKRRAERQAAETERLQTDTSLAMLALKFNAVTNWGALLPQQSLRPFTLDISRALVRSNHQPMLVKCDLIDLFERDGKIFANFSAREASVRLSLELQCSPDQLKSFTGSNEFSEFAVVARFDSVVRPKFQVNGNLDGEDSIIELDVSSDVFQVKGELLDALRLP